MPCIVAIRDRKFYGCYKTFSGFLNAIEDEGYRVRSSADLGEAVISAEYTCRDSRGDYVTFHLRFKPFDGLFAVMVHDDGTICNVVPLADYARVRALGELRKGHAEYIPCMPT